MNSETKKLIAIHKRSVRKLFPKAFLVKIPRAHFSFPDRYVIYSEPESTIIACAESRVVAWGLAYINAAKMKCKS